MATTASPSAASQPVRPAKTSKNQLKPRLCFFSAVMAYEHPAVPLVGLLVIDSHTGLEYLTLTVAQASEA